VHQVVAGSADLDRQWQATVRFFPSFREHFSAPVDDRETEVRIRFLVAAECAFVETEIAAVLAARGRCSYADIGDSDGSVRVIMEDRFGKASLSTLGINLQPGVVERMKQRGLDALCADAIEVGNRGQSYDVVSLFETMEHLPDPIGFLQKIAPVVGHRLVLSVPFIRRSRVGLAYLRPDWPQGLPATIENVHIFELSPEDWRKLFAHAGWKVEREQVVRQFPAGGPLNWLLSAYWRYTSFEGFYFVSLSRDTAFSSRYHIG
jgi:hypothetical protein